VVQTWPGINESYISDRAFWGAAYGMAIGINCSPFSISFWASLAGLQWREALARKHIRVRGLEFARVNSPIIAFTMAVGCAVLVGELYIMRKDSLYEPGS
jgi:Na+/H+ antiporter NhaD/arsenite permease-like protein